MNKKTKLFGIGGISLSILAIVGVSLLSNFKGDMLAKASGSYTCGSIKFGHNDATNGAETNYGISTSFPEDGELDSAKYTTDMGTKIVSIVGTGKIYCGTEKQGIVPLKIGNSGTDVGTLTITLNTEVVGVTVYCVEWKNGSENASVIVNGATAQSIETKGSNTSGTGNDVYEPHYFSFEETSVVTITKPSVKSCRFFISNISFRFAA